jgi:energy-coupling factor transporter ATP-binding protein EcfA2
MRLVSIELSGYRQFAEPTRLEFPLGLTGICGPNGVGKSKLVEAIGYALYGPHRRLLPKHDVASDIPSKSVVKAIPEVRLVIEIGGQRYEVLRTAASGKCSMHMDGVEIAVTASGVTAKSIELLRLTPDAFLGTFVARQREIASLQTLPERDRQRLVNRLIGISLVEKAVDMAQRRRDAARTAVEVARAGAGGSIAAAEERLRQNRVDLEVAIENEQQARAAHEAARVLSQQAHEVFSALQARKERCVQQETELTAYNEHITTLQQVVATAEDLVRQSQAAQTEVTQARVVLAETVNADAAVSEQEDLRKLDGLHTRQNSLQARLTGELFSKLLERDTLSAELTIARTEAESGKTAQVACDGPLAAARQECQIANDEMEQRAVRKAYVLEMGEGGVCDRCGQSLKGNLTHAVQHLEEERQNAEARKQSAEKRIHALTAQKQALSEERKKLEARCRDFEARLATYVSFSEEKIQTEVLLRELASQIDTLPARLHTQTYDAQQHEMVITERIRRQQAEQVIQGKQALAQRGDEAHESLLRSLANLEEKTLLQDELAAEIARLRPAANVLQEGEELSLARKTADDEALRAWGLSESAVSEARLRVETETRELERTRERWKLVDGHQTRLRIIERTEELMSRLLMEITAEARPRITELMEGWARALMGSHFQQIELTPDYRIRADNGSGLHFIEHFSGGEQTLLAIMLRVAISLYCQERAGYSSGFLILDEVFGDQDETHRVQLFQFLEEIKPNYHQILIVNHVSEVTARLDSIIDVTSTGDRKSSADLKV